MMNKVYILLVMLVLCWSNTTHAELILDLGPGGEGRQCQGCGFNGKTFGWAFDVSSAITVDGLGVWDHRANGIGLDVDVGLWDANGSLLASTTVSDGSSTEDSAGDGAWLFEDITALLLTPGEYVIGSVFFDHGPTAQFLTTITTIAEVSYLGDRLGPTDAGLQFPDDTTHTQGVFGPTLRLAESTVPVPANQLLVGLGFVILFLFMRRRTGGVVASSLH